MFAYIARRILIMIPMLFLISIISFVAIQLPPGDFMTSYVAGLRSMGDNIEQEAIDSLRERYGLGQPIHVQYFKWISGILLRGDWGQSMEWQRPVKELIWDRLGLTIILSLFALMVSWFVAIPVGVYSATHQYSIPDYIMSIISFIGVGVPGFLLALIVMYFAQTKLNMNVGGLFSEKFINAPWDGAKVVDMLKHLWIPVVILAVGGTAGGIRTTRANLLDELNKPYVELARAKGLTEGLVRRRHILRNALIPLFTVVGLSLGSLVEGAFISETIFGIPGIGRLGVEAFFARDYPVIMALTLIVAAAFVAANLVVDIGYRFIDPRIRY